MGMEVDLAACPDVTPHLLIRVFHSATCVFHAPSDLSGIGGMHREIIRATPRWRGKSPRHDCVFVDKDPELDGFSGLNAAQVHLFFSFKFEQQVYSCALVQWFEGYDNRACEETGLQMVIPHVNNQGRRLASVIHIDSILRSAHLIPAYGTHFTPLALRHYNSLYSYPLYYINKYADHHAHEVAF